MGVVERPMTKPFIASSASRKIGPAASPEVDGTGRKALPWWKRAIDLACCLAAAPVLLGCTLVAAIMTKWASPGPIFFRQERVGLGGRRFRLYKFRTMHVSADHTTHQTHFAELVRGNVAMQKLDRQGDARLIPGARWIRAAGLDELPQLINIARGEMSLVGPRPCIPYEYDQYSRVQRERFDAVPGLTGLWQVSGKNRTTFDEMVRLDIAYARRRSWWLDLSIILRTGPAIAGQVRDTIRARREAAKQADKPTIDSATPLAAR